MKIDRADLRILIGFILACVGVVVAAAVLGAAVWVFRFVGGI